MQIAPLALEIIDFWFAPRAAERAANSTLAEPPANAQSTGAVRGASPHITRAVWFRKDPAFDAEIRERFGAALAAGMAGAYGAWCTGPLGSLARIILLDQLTRNAFRHTPDAFAGDPGALATAEDAIERGFDHHLAPPERWFMYMPFEHSESLPQQERAVALFAALATQTGLAEPLAWAERHRDVIRRFGRFPHRNEILGRATTPDEASFLAQRGARF